MPENHNIREAIINILHRHANQCKFAKFSSSIHKISNLYYVGSIVGVDSVSDPRYSTLGITCTSRESRVDMRVDGYPTLGATLSFLSDSRELGVDSGVDLGVDSPGRIVRPSD